MSNALSTYDPLFYAQEGLIALENALGMAKRVHRGYEQERNAKELGSTISIKKPTIFTALAAPSAAQDINVSEVQILLNQWYEVKFALTDKELAYTGTKIITDHIRPAAYALANKIDQALNALSNDIPWYVDAAGSADITDIINVKKMLFNNAVPLQDPSMMHLEVDGIETAYLQALPAFNQQYAAGADGLRTLQNGDLGMKFGLNLFSNQNVVTHTKGTCNDTALQVLGATVKGATVISLDAVDGGVTGTLAVGDTFVIAGNTQRYAVTALNTASGNAYTSVAITPPLAQDHADNDAVTVNLDNHTAMIGFHRNAFAFASAPLPMLANQLGAKVETITDPITGLSLRSRMYYIGDTSKVYVALDVLFGVKTLDPNLAVLLRG